MPPKSLSESGTLMNEKPKIWGDKALNHTLSELLLVQLLLLLNVQFFGL